MKDIYFDDNYGLLYEKVENGKCELFNFRHSSGEIRHLYIKREIPIHIDEEPCFDIVTPYGYGGPLIVHCEENRKNELVEAFKSAFQTYCKEQRIVSEFIRFHPVFQNANDFKSCYEVENIRKTIGTNLKNHEDPIQKEFSKSAQKNIRQALRAGVQYSVIVNPPDLKEFKEIYYSTMKRNKANSYYYFEEDYFEMCIALFGPNLVLSKAVHNGKTIGMGLNFAYNNLLHTHLSGTLEEYHHLSPAYVLEYAIAKWGKENGIDLIHNGGGRTNSEEDSLYKFKKQFGKNLQFDFYIGKKIWNKELYQELCNASGTYTEIEFFPAYRSKAIEENRNQAKSALQFIQNNEACTPGD